MPRLHRFSRFDSRSNRLGFESLEARRLMVGDVVVQIVQGDLYITGDALDNDISIVGAANGDLTITGNNFTQINGNNIPVIITAGSINADIFISMNLGGDQVSIDGLTAAAFSGNLNVTFDGATSALRMGLNDDNFVTASTHIRGSNGNNNVFISNYLSGGALTMDLRGDADVVQLGLFGSVSTTDDLIVDSGPGADSMLLQQVFIVSNMWLDLDVDVANSQNIMMQGSSALGDITLLGDSVNMLFDVENVTAVGGFTASAQGGSARFQFDNSFFGRDANLQGGVGVDVFDIFSCNFQSNLFLNGNGDSDDIEVRGCLFSVMGVVAGGAGNDQIAVNNSIAPTLVVNAGDGNDNVGIVANALDELFAVLGAGNDNANIASNGIAVRGSASGGSGTNTRAGDNFFAPNFSSNAFV